VAKGARSRKKKALVDLLRALVAAGASRRRSSVPAEHRGARGPSAGPRPEERSSSAQNGLLHQRSVETRAP
jgi:hypothetical protein